MLDAMEPIGLDTLKATRTLQAAGFDAAQAEALVTVLGGPVLGTVATKEDIRDLRAEVRDFRTETKADIDGLRTEFKADIDGLRTELKGNINGLRTEFKGDIDGLRTEFKGDIDGLRTELKGDRRLRTELKGDIDGLRTELKGDIDGLRTELVTKAQMYRLLLVHATVVVGLIVGLQQLL